MPRRLFTFAGRIVVVCAFMGMVGCATILKGSSAPVSISSTPSSANVEIKRADGIVVEQGQTPMTVKLGKGKDYIVTISLDGYQTETASVLKGGVEGAVIGNLLCGGIPGLIVDIASNSMYKLEPSTINVQLKEVTAQDGSDTAIYAFLTIVDEDGTPQYATVEMTPVAAN